MPTDFLLLLLIILVAVIVIRGPKTLPKWGSALGQGRQGRQDRGGQGAGRDPGADHHAGRAARGPRRPRRRHATARLTVPSAAGIHLP